MLKHSSPSYVLLNLSPIIPGLWLRITMLLEHKIYYILGTLLIFENAVIML